MEKTLKTTYVITDIENADNIICVGYEYKIVWKGITETINGEVFLDEPDTESESYIEWSNVNRENLQTWIEAKVDTNDLYQKCMKNMISKNTLLFGRLFHDEENS